MQAGKLPEPHAGGRVHPVPHRVHVPERGAGEVPHTLLPGIDGKDLLRTVLDDGGRERVLQELPGAGPAAAVLRPCRGEHAERAPHAAVRGLQPVPAPVHSGGVRPKPAELLSGALVLLHRAGARRGRNPVGPAQQEEAHASP